VEQQRQRQQLLEEVWGSIVIAVGPVPQALMVVMVVVVVVPWRAPWPTLRQARWHTLSVRRVASCVSSSSGGASGSNSSTPRTRANRRPTSSAPPATAGCETPRVIMRGPPPIVTCCVMPVIA